MTINHVINFNWPTPNKVISITAHKKKDSIKTAMHKLCTNCCITHTKTVS